MLAAKVPSRTGKFTAFYNDRFRMAHFPPPGAPADANVSLVEIPLHEGERDPEVIYLTGEQAATEIATGALILLDEISVPTPNAERVSEVIDRPYPFETQVRTNASDRRCYSENTVLAGLRREGLIMTGAEYTVVYQRRAPSGDRGTIPHRL